MTEPSVRVERVIVTADAYRMVIAFREAYGPGRIPMHLDQVVRLGGMDFAERLTKLGERLTSGEKLAKAAKPTALRDVVGEGHAPWCVIESVERDGSWERVTLRIPYEAHKALSGIDARYALGEGASPAAVADALRSIAEAITEDEEYRAEAEKKARARENELTKGRFFGR